MLMFVILKGMAMIEIAWTKNVGAQALEQCCRGLVVIGEGKRATSL